jgi:uncharacterized protein DUF559
VRPSSFLRQSRHIPRTPRAPLTVRLAAWDPSGGGQCLTRTAAIEDGLRPCLPAGPWGGAESPFGRRTPWHPFAFNEAPRGHASDWLAAPNRDLGPPGRGSRGRDSGNHWHSGDGLGAHHPRSRSKLERRFLAQRLIVELDGRESHDTDLAFEKDRERDRLLLAEGWRVVRVTWRQLRDDGPGVIADLRTLLRRA